MEHTIKITPFYYTLKWDNDEIYRHYFDSKAELFNDISKLYAFNDCNGMYNDFIVIDIVCDGVNAIYCGWMPNMEYRFKDQFDHTLWDAYHPDWEH